MNLLKETLEAIEEANQTIDTVKFVSNGKVSCDWIDFANKARNYDYSSGYGTAEVIESLVIVFDDGTWLERAEYDGSEWWEYKKAPTIKPTGIIDFRTDWVIYNGRLE